jgi:ABC-type uncharacterized transport system substrate-binding protein
MFVNPDNPDPQSKDDAQQTETAARAAGLKVDRLNVSSDREVDSAFATLAERKDDALIVMADPFFTASANNSSPLLHVNQSRQFMNGVNSPQPVVS